uniref:Uncharacterized protein n=1 Tax=Helianthus annuus TaxID=4232 RepID=A0A251S069_HELAN
MSSHIWSSLLLSWLLCVGFILVSQFSKFLIQNLSFISLLFKIFRLYHYCSSIKRRFLDVPYFSKFCGVLSSKIKKKKEFSTFSFFFQKNKK